MQISVLRVLVLSHCLLNKSTRWWQEGKPFERNVGLANEIIEYILRHNVGVIQMPCPEFTFCGNPRPSRTKDEYEALLGFKEHCEKLAKIVAEQIRTLVVMSRKPRIQIMAIIGVKRSPSCAIRSAISKRNGTLHHNEKGIFIEALEKEIDVNQSIPFIEFDFDNPDEAIKDLKRLFGGEV